MEKERKIQKQQLEGEKEIYRGKFATTESGILERNCPLTKVKENTYSKNIWWCLCWKRIDLG